MQAQYGYVVVQMLMGHLDKNQGQEPRIKASIVGVLSETVFIAAGGSIGQCALEWYDTKNNLAYRPNIIKGKHNV